MIFFPAGLLLSRERHPLPATMIDSRRHSGFELKMIICYPGRSGGPIYVGGAVPEPQQDFEINSWKLVANVCPTR